MLKKIFLILKICFVALSLSTTSWFFPTAPDYPQNCRYVAYIKSNRARKYSHEWIKYRVTHLNLWFFNPNASGKLTTAVSDIEIDRICKIAHQNDVKVLASLGGGIVDEKQQQWWNQIEDSENRQVVIDAVLELFDRTNLDGVDLDLEGSSIPPNYSAFIEELSAYLKAREKLLTVAVGRWVSGPKISDAALSRFDLVNVMSYNYAGRNTAPGDNSSYNDAVKELKYWNETRGVKKENIVLGLPYYAKIWESATLEDKKACYTKPLKELHDFYFDMLLEEDFIKVDYNSVGVHRWISMNSVKTVIDKFQLATDYGGIMCWTFENDSFEELFCYSDVLKRLRDNYCLYQIKEAK